MVLLHLSMIFMITDGICAEMPGQTRVWNHGPIRWVLYEDGYKEGHQPLIATVSGPVKLVKVHDNKIDGGGLPTVHIVAY